MDAGSAYVLLITRSIRIVETKSMKSRLINRSQLDPQSTPQCTVSAEQDCQICRTFSLTALSRCWLRAHSTCFYSLRKQNTPNGSCCPMSTGSKHFWQRLTLFPREGAMLYRQLRAMPPSWLVLWHHVWRRHYATHPSSIYALGCKSVACRLSGGIDRAFPVELAGP